MDRTQIGNTPTCENCDQPIDHCICEDELTEKAQWIIEHGAEYAVPAEISALVASGQLLDNSWHNDVCPRFTSSDNTREIWVDHPDCSSRENGNDWPRFLVFYDRSGDFMTGQKSLYEGNDLQAALAVLIAPTTNVFDYFVYSFFREPACLSLKDYPMDSVCGQTCRKIIDSAITLLALCDPHDDVRSPIVQAVQSAIEIVCIG